MSFWQEQIKIGNRSFPRFIGGPLDGITDSPFRQLVREFSKEELLYTEMRHVACVANDKGGKKALKFAQMERPLNYQIAVNKLDFVQKACEKVLAAGVDAIDLNVGCPAKNVIGSGSGSALMADLPRLEKILKLLRGLITDIPFTVKIRAGFKEKNAIEVARLVQDCGADALAIHPRLRTQKFEGRPDYQLAAQVKQSVQIPVIISGGVVNFKVAKMVYEQTGVDGFLIGRGIWAKPWKLHEMNMHAQGKPFQMNHEAMLDYALKHLDSMLEHYGEKGLYMYRKHVPFYVRGLPGASTIRQSLVRAQEPELVRELLQSMRSSVQCTSG